MRHRPDAHAGKDDPLLTTNRSRLSFKYTSNIWHPQHIKHIAEARKLALPKYHTGQLLVGSIAVARRHSIASNGTERAIYPLLACEYGGEVRVINHRTDIFWLDVVRMSRPNTNYFLDQYEAAVDEIVADCHGDMRGALRALILANEQLERKLQRLGTELFERLGDGAPERLLH